MAMTTIQYTITIKHGIDWNDPDVAKQYSPYFATDSADVQQYVKDMVSEGNFEVTRIEVLEHNQNS